MLFHALIPALILDSDIFPFSAHILLIHFAALILFLLILIFLEAFVLNFFYYHC